MGTLTQEEIERELKVIHEKDEERGFKAWAKKYHTKAHAKALIFARYGK